MKLLDYMAESIYSPLSRGSSRALATVFSAGLCFGLGTLASASGSSSPSLGDATAAFLRAHDLADKAGQLTSDLQAPAAFEGARTSFELAWRESPLTVRKAVDQQLLSRSLARLVEYHRTRETHDMRKAGAFFWADEAVRHYGESPGAGLLIDAYCNKASIFTDMVGLYNKDPQRFRDLSREAADLMSVAATVPSAGVDAKTRARVSRLSGTFNYDMARPSSGVLSDQWDNGYLEIAFRRVKEGFELDRGDFRNTIQLAKTVHRIIRNNRQNPSYLKKWEDEITRAQSALKTSWETEKQARQSPRSRLAPLNNLAVLTLDMIAYRWHELSDYEKPNRARFYLDILENTAIPAQQEVRELLPKTELRASYAFDIAYDLSRMFALKSQLAKLLPDTVDSSFSDAELHFVDAFRASTLEQRGSMLKDLTVDPCFTGLNTAERNRLTSIGAGQ